LGAEITIRPFADDDALPARELFITVNRLLSPADLRDAFEAYIERALVEEIDRIPAYYGQHGLTSYLRQVRLSASARGQTGSRRAPSGAASETGRGDRHIGRPGRRRG